MKNWMGEPVIYATYKYDGHGMVLAKDSIGIATLSSSKRTWRPDQNVWFRNFVRNAPNNTKLHVEVFVQGGEATDVITELVNNGDLSMLVTGIEKWHGVDMCLAALHNVDALCDSCGLRAVQWLTWLKHVDYADLAIHLKIEGFVLKSHSYVPGKMYKVKPIRTADLVISGFIDGKGKYAGLVGAIECMDSTGRIVCQVSGMTDVVRVELDDKDIGRIIEVAYQKVTKSGKLRHPRFKRFRDDKAQAERIRVCQ